MHVHINSTDFSVSGSTDLEEAFFSSLLRSTNKVELIPINDGNGEPIGFILRKTLG